MQGLCNSVLSVNWLSNSRNRTFFGYFGYVLSGTEHGTDFSNFGYFDLGFGCFGLVFGSQLIMPILTSRCLDPVLKWLRGFEI